MPLADSLSAFSKFRSAGMPEDTIEVSVRMADRGEVGYRMVSASISSREGSLAGAPVAFTIEDGPGTLASAGGRERLVDSDEWGIAEVNWYPEQHARSSPEADVVQTVTIKAVCESAAEVSLNVASPLWKH